MITIYSKSKTPNKKSNRNLYQTNRGDLTIKELADLLEVTPNTLRQRINKYGLTSYRVISPPPIGKPRKNNSEPTDEWKNLSDEPRWSECL